MSGMNSILQEMAEAQRAVELVPVLRDEVRAKSEENLKLETKVSNLGNDLDKANQKIRELADTIARLEVERDEISFREMETADKLASLQGKIGALVDLAQELKPPVPAEDKPMEAEPEPIRAHDDWEPQSTEPQPVGSNAAVPTLQESSADTKIAEGYGGTSSSPQPGPKYEDQDTIDPNLGFLKPSQPYAGMEYYQKPIGVSTDDFVAGGGTAPSWYVKPAETRFDY